MISDNVFKKSFEGLFENRVVIYGAGVKGIYIYKTLTNYFKNIDIACFCDSYKTGSMIGLPIISPEELMQICAHESVIIITAAPPNDHKEISDNLLYLGVEHNRIFSRLELEDFIAQNINDSRIDEWNRIITCYKMALPKHEKLGLYLRWWCPEHCCENDILLYQPGKVGSCSVLNSLSAIGVNASHIHYITDYFIYDLIPEIAWEPNVAELEIIRKCSQYYSDTIKKANNTKIITLVREPLSRDFSHVLYHLDVLRENGYLSSHDSLLEVCTEGIRKRATQNGKCKYGYEFEWFNQELKNVFGVDVYSHPFDREKGYTIIKRDNIEVLVIKLEKLNELERVIGEFTNAPHFKLINANRAHERYYKDLYKSIRESIKIPREVVSLYYDDNPYMNHFYSEGERESFLQKWKNNLAD